MLATAMRIAACELWVDVPDVVQPLGFSLAHQIAAGPDRRRRIVKSAIETARLERVDVLILPLWTWPGTPALIPGSLLDLTRRLTVVLGLFGMRRTNSARTAIKGQQSVVEERLYVISDRRVLAGGTCQLMLNSSSQELSHAAELADVLTDRNGGRRWRLPGVGEGLLVACGENNVLRGGGPSPTITVEKQAVARGLTVEFLRRFRIVANPTHTRQGPQASRDKKTELSRGGVCVAVGNAHPSYRYRWREGRTTTVEKMRASRRTAEFYRRGDPVPLQPVRGDLERDGFRLTVLPT
jgi:hypothetical protein